MWSVPESATDRIDWPTSAPPPWPARVRATLWWHPSTVVARRIGTAGPRGHVIPMTLAMMVEYLESPVGPYREILASPVLRAPSRRTGLAPRMAVPFIAVDSEASVHGGRAHWRLPKVMADFDGDVLGDFCAAGADWRVSTATTIHGPRLPIAGALGFAQPDVPGDRLRVASAALRGHFRFARVEMQAEGPTLNGWLTPGSHFGIVITDGLMTTGPGKLR